MYVDTETMSKEEYFTATQIFVEKYKKMSSPATVPKHWLGFSYISSEYYELYINFINEK